MRNHETAENALSIVQSELKRDKQQVFGLGVTKVPAAPGSHRLGSKY